MPRQITRHMQNDRVERMLYIVNTVGMGDIIHEHTYFDRQNRPAIYQITNTGVAIVLNDKREVVTLYLIRMNQLVWAYRNENIPPFLRNKVRKNEQKYAKGQDLWKE